MHMKPLIFLSHSSRDADALVRLKKLLVERTSSTVDLFLSSDGVSITAGRKWIDDVLSALSQATVVFTFLSPNALHSQWVFFEAGLAYNRNIQVVPVGIFGVDVGEIPPPLGLLQGFNLDSPAGLRTLVEILNTSLGTSYRSAFIDRDFAYFEKKTDVFPTLADGMHVYRVFSLTKDGEIPHELLEVEIQYPRMTVRTKMWESYGIVEQNRYVGRFRFFRGNSPHDLGIHDFTFNGQEFTGSAKLDSGKWFAEGLIWRPVVQQ
jgi:TIR domain